MSSNPLFAGHSFAVNVDWEPGIGTWVLARPVRDLTTVLAGTTLPPMLDNNRWRVCFLRGNYQRKLRQVLVEQFRDRPETVAQHPSPSFAISTSDFDLTSSSSQALAEAGSAVDSAARLEPEREQQRKQEDEP